MYSKQEPILQFFLSSNPVRKDFFLKSWEEQILQRIFFFKTLQSSSSMACFFSWKISFLKQQLNENIV